MFLHTIYGTWRVWSWDMGGYLKIQIYAQDLGSVAFENAIFYISQAPWRLLYGCCFKTDDPTFFYQIFTAWRHQRGGIFGNIENVVLRRKLQLIRMWLLLIHCEVEVPKSGITLTDRGAKTNTENSAKATIDLYLYFSPPCLPVNVLRTCIYYVVRGYVVSGYHVDQICNLVYDCRVSTRKRKRDDERDGLWSFRPRWAFIVCCDIAEYHYWTFTGASTVKRESRCFSWKSHTIM